MKIFLMSKWDIFQHRPYVVHKLCLNIFWKKNVTKSIFPDHNMMKIKINNRTKAENSQVYKIKSYANTHHQPMAQRRITKKIRKYLRNEWVWKYYKLKLMNVVRAASAKVKICNCKQFKKQKIWSQQPKFTRERNRKITN